MSSHTVIRGAAHANAMRADKMRALAVKLAAALELLAEDDAEASSEPLANARFALADAREAGVLP